jgi:hypothetical protein
MVNPEDLPVRIELIKDLNLSSKPADRALAENYLGPLSKERPNDPKVQALVGSFDWRSAALSQDKAIAQKCIDEYRRWAAEAPAGSKWRNDCKICASAMERYEASWRAPQKSSD